MRIGAMRLIDWLIPMKHNFGIKTIIWIDEDMDDSDEPLWIGDISDIPWEYVQLHFSDSELVESPVSYRDNLGNEFGNKPGFVIILKDR